MLPNVSRALFIPFLAATLLYLNNFLIPADSGVPNSALTNAVLLFALILFCGGRGVGGRLLGK